MKIAIIGFGLEGQAAYDYWQGDHEITVCDQNEMVADLPEDVDTHLGVDYLSGLDEFDLIVRSPFVHPRLIVEANDVDILDIVTTNTNEFLKACPTRNIIGVTGTKGKGTTSTLIARMLAAAGKNVHLGGNIGIPALDLLKSPISPNDWIVLELSSFQLIDVHYSPHIAVCLMIASEHQDWHEDYEEYIAAKQQLFIHQDEDDIAIYFADNEDSISIADASLGKQIPYFASPGAAVRGSNIFIGEQKICEVSELKLLGKHNWQNICAAITCVWQVTQNVESIRSVVTSFSGLEHRLEFVRQVSEVRYFDDSFGTTPETAIVAMQAFTEPKVVILGGSDKGASYDDLASAVITSNVRHVLLIGNQASRIQKCLEVAGYKSFSAGGSSMPEIINKASQIARPGDVVLLSTACASFDLFENYKDRGDKFKQAVGGL